MINPKDPSVNPIQSIGATQVAGANTAGSNKAPGQASMDGAASHAGQQHSQSSQHSSATPQPEKCAPANTPVLENPDAKQPTQSPQQQAGTVGQMFSGKWDQYIGSAKVTWGELTDDELMKSEGNLQKLAGLVEQRYALSRDIAETQVKKFLDTCSAK